MTTVRELLRNLELGNSVAEFDEHLESYFVETQPFLDLINGRKDIIAGDKGTGKTAIFKVLYRRYENLAPLKGAIVLPAFNPTGSPIFLDLVEKGPLQEAEYNTLWKAYLLSFVGNWVLKTHGLRKAKAKQLDQLLRGLDLRTDSDQPRPAFDKIIQKLGSLLHWKSAELEVQTSAAGTLTIKPRVEFRESAARKEIVPIEAALQLLNEVLAEHDAVVWIAMDRLDEAFQGNPKVEIPALRALFRTYLDLSAFKNLKLKLFVRRDLFNRIVTGGFVNLTHVNARKIEVIWDEEDLLSLLCRRVKQNEVFCDSLKLKGLSDKAIFNALFPKQVDQGSRKPETWVWIMGRIRDGNQIKPPRNLIDLVSLSREAQLRREDRSSREYRRGKPLMEPEAVRAALTQLSTQRVSDTLLAEARELAPIIEKFRKGKPEHNDESLAKLLGARGARDYTKPLVELGFLEEVAGNYKVPMLYRGGLGMTQGKAFGDDEPSDDEDE